MQTRKRIWASAAAVGMAVMLAACGGKKEDAASSVHDYTYVSFGGNEYSGTYTGDWENGQPNGEGSFSGKSGENEISLVGTWADGQPNGQCRRVLKTETFTQTYSGDYFYGEWKGNGNLKVEYPDGTISATYDGEFRDGKWNGSGEETHYYIAEEAAEQGYDRRVYKGQFSDGAWNGEGELTFYSTAEVAEQQGYDRRVFKGQFSDDVLAGETTAIFYYTSEFAEANGGINCEILTGQYSDNGFVEPYRYAFYNGNKVLEEGRVRDGKYISDEEKAFNDSVYDGLREIAGDGILGDLYDIFGPEIYDRDAE